MVMNLLQKPKQIIKKKPPISLMPLKPNPNPIVGRPVTQPASNPMPQASTGLSIASQNRPKPLSTPHQGQMGANGAMQSAKPPQQINPAKIASFSPSPLRPGSISGQPLQQLNLKPIEPYAVPQQYAQTASMPKTTTTATATATASSAPPNANVQAALNGMSPAMKREIERKAKAGEPLEVTTEAKRWLYSFYKGQGATTTPPTPGGPPAPNAPPTSPVATPNVAPPVNNGQANWNSNQSIPDYGSMTPEMIQALLNGYTNNPAYDPATDPAYQASLALANKQADAAGLSTMEDMNERGILNSTITSDRVGQIKQGASDAVIGNIPGFQANYNNNHHNNMSGLSNLLNTTIGASQWQQTHGEENRRYDKDFSLDEAQVTGSYMPAEAQSIINTVMNAKKANTQPGLSAAERAKNADIANSGRQQLAAMGIDVSGIAGDVTYESAVQNLPGLGRNTIIQQQTDLDKTVVMGKEVNSKAQSLVQTILKAKGDNEKGIGNSKANARIANDARAQLSAMGFDISGIGGNVKYDQAVKNAAKITGKNTLARDELNSNHTLAGRELALERDRLNSDDALGNRELAFREQEALIRADLESRGLDLDEVRNAIDMFSAESDAEYKARQSDNDVTEQEAYANTNKAIGHIAGAKSAAEGWAYIHSQTQPWAESGVDFKEVVAALEKKFPGSTTESEDFDSDYGGMP